MGIQEITSKDQETAEITQKTIRSQTLWLLTNTNETLYRCVSIIEHNESIRTQVSTYTLALCQVS